MGTDGLGVAGGLGSLGIEAGEDVGGGLLDGSERGPEGFGVSVVEVDVVGARRAGIEPHGRAHGVRRGLGFELADPAAQGLGSAGPVEQLVRQLVDQRGELLGGFHAFQHADLAAHADALGASEPVGPFESDAEVAVRGFEPEQGFAGVSRHSADLGQRLAFGLRDVEDEARAEAEAPGFGLFDDGLLFRSAVHHRHEDEEALLALSDASAQGLPRGEPGDAGGVGLLRQDEADVVEAVAVEPSHGLEEVAQVLGPAGFEGVGQEGECPLDHQVSALFAFFVHGCPRRVSQAADPPPSESSVCVAEAADGTKRAVSARMERAFRDSEASGIHKARLSLNDSGWLVPERSRRAGPITALMNPSPTASLPPMPSPSLPKGDPPLRPVRPPSVFRFLAVPPGFKAPESPELHRLPEGTTGVGFPTRPPGRSGV